MKRVLTVAALTAALLAAPAAQASAQGTSPAGNCNSIEISAGLPPIQNLFIAIIGALTNIGYDSEKYDNKGTSTPAMTIGYYYSLSDGFDLGGLLGYNDVCFNHYLKETGEKEASTDFPQYSTTLVGRYKWISNDNLHLYSSLGLGAWGLGSGKVRLSDGISMENAAEVAKKALSQVAFGIQLTPIGVSFGKDLYGFAELTIGTISSILQAGVGYRF